jgi:hypothetical protein
MLDEDGNPIEEKKTVVADDDAAAAEKARAEAKEKSEKSKPSDEAAKLLKEVMKLKEKAKAEEEARKALEAKYGNIDLEAAKEALKKAEEAEQAELERKGEYERLLSKQKEKTDALIEAERTARKELEDKLASAARAVDELSLGNAFANSKFIQDKVALTPNKTRALYGSHFEVEDGKLVAYDKPKGAADRTPLISASGDALSFDEAIAEIINTDPDKEYLLKVETREGAKSKASATVIDPDKGNRKLSSLDRIAQGLKNNKNFGPSGPTLT